MATTAASTTQRLVDQAAQTAESAILGAERSTQRVLESLADTVGETRDQVSPRLVRIAEQAEGLVRRGADAVRDSSHQLRERAGHASEVTVRYIRDEPVKSVLFAAAAGATIMALATLAARARHPH